MSGESALPAGEYGPVDVEDPGGLLDASVEADTGSGGLLSGLKIGRTNSGNVRLKSRSDSFKRFRWAGETVTDDVRRVRVLRSQRHKLHRGYVAEDEGIDLRDQEFEDDESAQAEAPAWWSRSSGRCNVKCAISFLDRTMMKNLIRLGNSAAVVAVAYIGVHAVSTKHDTTKKRLLMSTTGYLLMAFSGFALHDGLLDCLRPQSGGVAFLYRDRVEEDGKRRITPRKQKLLKNWRGITFSLFFFMTCVILWNMSDIASCLSRFSRAEEDGTEYSLLEESLSHFDSCSETLARAPSGLATARELVHELRTICHLELFICVFYIWYYAIMFPLWVQSLQLGSALADDAVQDLARTLFEKDHDGKHKAITFNDEEWAEHVHQPAMDLARVTMPALSFWGPSVGAFLIANIMNVLFQLPSMVNSFNSTGSFDKPMNLVQLVVVIVALQVALVPASVSTSCDVLNDQLNELRNDGGKKAHDRALVIETFFARLNRQQGLGFTVYMLVVDKIVLKKIVVLFTGSAGAIFTLLTAYSLDTDPHNTIGGALEVPEYLQRHNSSGGGLHSAVP